MNQKERNEVYYSLYQIFMNYWNSPELFMLKLNHYYLHEYLNKATSLPNDGIKIEIFEVELVRAGNEFINEGHTLPKGLDLSAMTINGKPIFIKPTPIPTKPPIGLLPRKLWEEERRKEVVGAIRRYLDNNSHIPQEWIDEYNSQFKVTGNSPETV